MYLILILVQGISLILGVFTLGYTFSRHTQKHVLHWSIGLATLFFGVFVLGLAVYIWVWTHNPAILFQ